MTEPQTQPGTEVARAGQQKATVFVGRAQSDLDAQYRLAAYMANSNAVPDAYKGKPTDVLVVSMMGADLGLSPMQSVLNIDMVKGRPTMRANLWVALARQAGHKVRVVENTATSTTVMVVRADDPDGPITATYTIEDAKTAGLTSNSNYQKNPKAMLYARAASTAVRQACPEVALGFSDEYELADDARPTLAQVAAERTNATTPAAVDAPEPVHDAEVVDEDEDRRLLAELDRQARGETEPVDLFGGE